MATDLTSSLPVRLPKPLLDPQTAATKFRLMQFPPSPDLEFFVQNYWVVSWSLPAGQPYRQDILPYPCVNVAFEANRSVAAGITRGKASRVIEGSGCAFGIKFKPGAFYPFFKASVSRLTNQLVPLAEIFGPTVLSYERSVLACGTEKEMVPHAEAFLREQQPERDQRILEIGAIVDEVTRNRELTKVDQLTQRFGLTERTSQRLFSRYVGVSLKWVIRIYRLQEAADRIAGDQRFDGAALAAELGYFDQAHFAKDFKTVIGQTPSAYARQAAGSKSKR